MILFAHFHSLCSVLLSLALIVFASFVLSSGFSISAHCFSIESCLDWVLVSQKQMNNNNNNHVMARKKSNRAAYYWKCCLLFLFVIAIDQKHTSKEKGERKRKTNYKKKKRIKWERVNEKHLLVKWNQAHGNGKRVTSKGFLFFYADMFVKCASCVVQLANNKQQQAYQFSHSTLA